MKTLKFNEQMAQAIKDGLKTQMRRPIKPQPIEENSGYFTWFSEWGLCVDTSFDNLFQQILENEYSPYKICDTHDADGTQIKITDIRVERLQDISEEDAIAEGVTDDVAIYYCGWIPTYNDPDSGGYTDFIRGFENGIWRELPYQPPYDWNSNPWVWVIDFEKVD